MAKIWYLSFEDRQKISQWYLERESVTEIGRRLGFHFATIYREIQRGYTGGVDKNGRPEYSPEFGQRRFEENMEERRKKRVDTFWRGVEPKMKKMLETEIKERLLNESNIATH